MRVFGLLLTGFVAVILASGCVSGYRNMAQTQVQWVRTSAGEVAEAKEVKFLAFREVIENSPNVRSVTRMTDLKGEREPGHFALSPTEDHLVFQAIEKTGGRLSSNLWRLPTTGGTAMTRLTAGQYWDIEPSVSSDGKIVYFSSNRNSRTPKLYSVQATGAGGITRLTQSDAEDRAPSAEATEGEYVYYMSRPFNAIKWQIWRVSKNGALPTQLKAGSRPQVSPDGQTVLFSALDLKTSRLKIWTMRADGTGETQLTTDTESDDVNPAWSPDGKRIVYSSNSGKDSNGKRNYDIWMMNRDGTGVTQLTTNGSTDMMPRFSPDGRHIYFLSNRGFFWDIWRMEIVQ